MQFIAQKLKALVPFDHLRIGDELVISFCISSFGIVIFILKSYI